MRSKQSPGRAIQPGIVCRHVFQSLSGSRGSNRLSRYVYRDSGDGILYGNSYSYDKNGNITQINEVYTVSGQEKTRVLARYEYDWADQLQKETRYSYSGTSSTAKETTEVIYSTDTAGNLREVITKVNGKQSEKISYGYGNSRWTDSLTELSVNGVTQAHARPG